MSVEKWLNCLLCALYVLFHAIHAAGAVELTHYTNIGWLEIMSEIFATDLNNSRTIQKFNRRWTDDDNLLSRSEYYSMEWIQCASIIQRSCVYFIRRDPFCIFMCVYFAFHIRPANAGNTLARHFFPSIFLSVVPFFFALKIKSIINENKSEPKTRWCAIE